MKLKNTLEELQKNNYALTDALDYQELLDEMIKHIGDPDPILRDDLIYMTFYHFMKSDVFNKKDLKKIFNVILDDEHLFFEIGNDNEKAVFTRSFSLLVIPLLLSKQLESPFLTSEDFHKLYDAMKKYLKSEKDYRGYVEKYGWAHAMAHSGDVIAAMAHFDELTHKHWESLLKVIGLKIRNNNHAYVNREDERIVTAILKILDHKRVDLDEFNEWIENFKDFKTIGNPLKDDIILLNIKNFLRSLYFRLLSEKAYDDQIIIIKETLKDMSSYY